MPTCNFKMSLLAYVCLSLFFFSFYACSEKASHAMDKSTSIFFENPIQDTLFFSKMIWGISSNHERIGLSSSLKTKRSFDPETDYMWSGVSSIYYRQSNDSLFLFTHSKQPVPPKFDSPIKIIIIPQTGAEMLQTTYKFENGEVERFW